DLVNPLDGTSTVPLSTLISAFGSGKFLFDSSLQGQVDSQGTPKTGPVEGTIKGSAGLEFEITGTGVIAGIPGLDATAAVSLDIPDFLTVAPQIVSYYDPIGFGHSAITFADTTTAVPLGVAAPVNGQLTQDLYFIVSNGASEAIGLLAKSATTSNSSLSQLEG